MNIETISIEQIKSLSGSLKKLDAQWAKDLSELITNDKKNGEPMSITKLHNIVNSKIKNQRYRRLFLNFGARLLNKYNESTKEALEALETAQTGTN